MKPRLAITIGDPAGIGPEVALRCAADPEVQRQCIPILLGDVDVLRMIAERLGCALPSNVIERSDGLEQLESVAEPTIVDYETDFQFLSAGHANEQTGWASYRYVCDAIDAATISGAAAELARLADEGVLARDLGDQEAL